MRNQSWPSHTRVGDKFLRSGNWASMTRPVILPASEDTNIKSCHLSLSPSRPSATTANVPRLSPRNVTTFISSAATNDGIWSANCPILRHPASLITAATFTRSVTWKRQKVCKTVMLLCSPFPSSPNKPALQRGNKQERKRRERLPCIRRQIVPSSL